MKHEDKVLRDILEGREPEKRIMVQVGVHKKKEQSPEEIEKKRQRDDALKSARMPWFCPKCEDIMNGKFDRKFYYLRGTCFDCVVKEETTMKINGTYDLYEKMHLWKNSLSVLRDAKQQFEEAEQALSDPTFVNEFGDVEMWKGVDLDHERKNIREILKDIDESVENITKDLRETEDEFERRQRVQQTSE